MMFLHDPESDGLCRLLACMLCEVFSAITSGLLDIARQSCELLLLCAGWLLTATRIGTYIFLCLHLSLVSPSLGWLLMTVFWFGEAVTKAGARGNDVSFVLAEIWKAFTMLALSDFCVSEIPAMARLVVQLLTSQFDKALDVDLSLSDYLIRCYTPSDNPRRSGGSEEAPVAPEHKVKQDAPRQHDSLRVTETWISDVLGEGRHGRKRAQHGAPLSRSFLHRIPFGPTRNRYSRMQLAQTMPLGLGNLVDTSGPLRARKDRDESAAGANAIQDPVDASESSGEDQRPAARLTTTFENPDSDPELGDGSGRGEMAAGEELDGSRELDGEAGRGSMMDAHPDGSQGLEGDGGPVPAITAQEPGDGPRGPEGDGGQTPCCAAQGPDALLEGFSGFEMRRSPLAASGSNGEEFEARGTRDVRRPVGLGESMAAGFAHDAPVAHCGLHLTHVGDSGLEASDRLLVWGPHPSCEAVSGLEDSMEWESTGQPIVVQASAFLSGSVGVDYGSPMELDNAAQEPIDLRGSFGEVVDDAADDCENSMEWEQTFAVVVHGPAVANELESGFLDSLSGLSLHDETAAGPEHMAAVEAAGRPGAVLEVFIHETAGQLSTMTISDPEAFLEDVDMTDAAVQQVAPIFDAETDAQISVTAVDVTHQEPSLTTLMEDAQFLDDVAPCSPRAVVDASVAAVTAPSPPGEAITYLAWESLVETMSDEEAQRWLEMEAEIDLLLSESPVPAGDALSAPVSAQGRVRVVSEAETQQVPEMVIAPEVGQERALLAIQAQEDGVTVHEDRQEVLDGGAEPPSPPERRQATEPAPSPEAPLPALPPSPIVSVPQPETPAHGDTQRPSFDTAPEPPRMGENEEDPEEEVKTDDAETVAARPKLVARGPRVASTAPHQPRQDDAEIPKDAVDAKDDEGIEPGLTPGSPPAAPEPRREPSSVETAAGEAATSQKRVDGVHPTLPDSKTTPGTGSAAAASTTPAPAPTTPRPGGLAQVPQSAEEKERMKREKLQRQANALRNRKANVFHNPKRNTAPSTAYGTRAAGSADRDRQLRSAQTLQDLNATERQPGGRGPDTTNYGPQTILVVPGAALQGRLPSEGE